MITVSRSDISCDALTSYPANSRFIKLPIENYLKLLTMDGVALWDTINRPQLALINAVNHPNYRFIVAALSRRLGKTFIANVIGQLVALIPNCNVLIMSPNYNLSSISFELQRRFIKHFDLEVIKDNHKDRIIELSNNSTVRMGSISTVDSCVGRSYDLIIFDEAALSDGGEQAFNVALRPTLDKPNSKAIFISTPRGRHNWFANFYNRGFLSSYPMWCSIHADYTENPRMQESDVDEARSTMTKSEFEQEYCANFNVYEGQIYHFSKDCVVDWVGSDSYEVIAGIDPGFRDPTAMVVVVYDNTRDKFHVVDEYCESEAVTAHHAQIFQGFIDQWNISQIFIDHAAAQFAGDLAYTYDISTTKAKKDVLPGIAYMQTLVEKDRLLVAPHCVKTLQMLDQYKWDSRETLTTERPHHDIHSHIADALRYCCYSFVV